LDDLIKLIKKKGFKDTINILANADAHRLVRRDFYEKLNETSYYNSFMRVRDELIDLDLLEIDVRNGGNRRVTYFNLTEKGLYIHEKLNKLNDFLLNHH